MTKGIEEIKKEIGVLQTKIEHDHNFQVMDIKKGRESAIFTEKSWGILKKNKQNGHITEGIKVNAPAASIQKTFVPNF